MGEDDRNKVAAAITRTWVISKGNILDRQVIENKAEKPSDLTRNLVRFPVKWTADVVPKGDIYAFTGSATESRMPAQFLPVRAAWACLWKA